MKAFLKGSDNVYPLAPKVTTLGKDGCDICIQTPGVDQQHAFIEYNEHEDCYVLQDLNTAQGTYVNDCRVQNATVRLAPGDIIRLGYGGTPFELHIENPPPISYPPVQQRPAWTQPLTLLADNMTFTQGQTDHQLSTQQPLGSLPYLATGTTTITLPSTMWTPSQQHIQNMPRPPLRTRPLSAGSASRRMGSVFDQIRTNQTLTSPVMSPATSQRNMGGWVNGADRRMMPTQVPVNVEISRIQEKEQKIMQLSEEVSRLRSIESESFRKDQQLQQLQQQLSDAHHRLTTQGPLIMGIDVDASERVVQLENELTTKKQEISALRGQSDMEELSNTVQHNSPPTSPVGGMTDELSQKIKELNNVKNELERVKKDKSITSGLVTQMQRDMSSKDSTISKLTREIETLKKELRERDTRLTTMSAKVTKLNEPNMKASEERDAREKELISLRQKFKSTENKIQEQQDLVNKLKEELEKTKLAVFEEKQLQKKQQIEADQISAELKDMQRTERLVRVDMEQATKRLERFRSRIIQVTFSTPGVKAPDAEISDDELVETLKKIIDERTSFYQKVKDIEKELRAADTANNTFKKSIHDLRNHIMSIVTHLKSNGYLVSSLKQEIELLQSICTDESLVWVKDNLIDLLNGAMSWEQNIESSLEQCGVNVKLSNDEPGKHIALLFAKWESSISEKEKLSSQITQLEQQYKTDLELTLNTHKQDAEHRVADAMEKTRLEAEERLNRALEEVRAVEMEQRENAVMAERKKIEELEENLAQLRQNYVELQSGTKSQMEETSTLVTQIEEYSALETSLREEITQLEKERSELELKLTQVTQDFEKKFEEDISGYREQNKQHSVTICAMEERLIKMTKKCKEYQEENSVHKKTIHELRGELTNLKNKPPPKPALPPKPKVIIQKPSEDFVAMENLIVVLRKESLELKGKVQDQEDVILGLRRDLAGAHARLSDITGELSETQKRENEKSKELLLQRERELTDVRQQLAKLSKIIDKQKEELRSLEVELSKEKSISVKYKSNVEQYQSKIENLEGALENEREEQKKQLSLLDQEGRITSEMTALGAQCRGERHEQVIMRQREALAELRARIKTLEVSKPPLPTQDQALQQVIMLKKELAEMRANQALSEDKVALGSLDREVSRARGLLANVNPEADMERSAHRETLDALESSENSYLILLRAMASCLELESVEGLRQIGHIPKDERERLLAERESSCQLLANRIKVLKERIARKDELLQGYERDLVKMRQSQELADRKALQVEVLSNDVKTRSEETHYLRESLNRTRDRLDQEKRLNSAIKQRKTFHLENERSHLGRTGSSIHSARCQREDIMGKNSAKKRAQKEVTKRKNYEISTLKSELSEKERALYDTEYRLATLENSMGIERPTEIVES